MKKHEVWYNETKNRMISERKISYKYAKFPIFPKDILKIMSTLTFQVTSSAEVAGQKRRYSYIQNMDVLFDMKNTVDVKQNEFISSTANKA